MPRQSPRWEAGMLTWLERIKGWLLPAGLAPTSVFYRGRASGRQAER